MAVVAQPGFFVKVLALEAQRLGDFVDQQLFNPAMGVIGGRPDDVTAGFGQLAGQTVDVVVIIVDLAVAVNQGQGLEGARVIDVLTGRLVLVALGEQGVAVPGIEGALAVNGLDAAATAY